MRTKLMLMGLLCGLSTYEARAEKAWGIDSKALLVSFDTDRPQFPTSLQLIRGLMPGEQLLAIDFRPATGQLYGLGSSSRIYTIDRETAQAKVVGAGMAFTPALDGTEFGFDFNPTVDRIRVTSNTGQNLRLHPDTGVVAATDAALNYADGMRPMVVGSAYTNSFAGSTSTVLYNLDQAKRAIVTQAPPNDGVLGNVKPLINIDLSRVAGFDISPVTNRGYLVVRESGSSKSMLYEIYYETGDHNPIGNLWFFEQFGGIAVEPPNAK
jgi:hypothetical protein